LEVGFRLGIDDEKREIKETIKLSKKTARGEDGRRELLGRMTDKYLHGEEEEGQASGKLPEEGAFDLVGRVPFQVSPFGTVEVEDKDPRHVRDLSFPHVGSPHYSPSTPSVNDRLAAFSPHPRTLWCDPPEFAALLASLPDAPEDDEYVMQTDDVSRCYRRVRIHPEDW
ncbi:hypothetical protein JCM8097_008500, partial [Rhodosporidiobolus ruineniae]